MAPVDYRSENAKAASGAGALVGPQPSLPAQLQQLREKMDGARDKVASVMTSLRRNRPWQPSIPHSSPVLSGRVYTSPLRNGKFAAIIPGDSVVEAVVSQGVNQTLSLYNAALIGRLILTWFPNPPQAIAGPLSTICDPYLNLFRGLIPAIGGIDLSPILAFVVLDLFTNSAAALPCEVGADGQPVVTGPWTPGKGARAWHERMKATRLRRKAEADGNRSE